MVTTVSPTGLTLLSDPQDVAADVVFVHGLQGHPYKTWTFYPSFPSAPENLSSSEASKKSKIRGLSRLLGHTRKRQETLIPAENSNIGQDEENGAPISGIFWPRDLLKEDLPQARIMTFGYNTNIQQGYHAVNQGNIFSHARDLLYELEAKRRKAPTRRLIFVAHSLGGILVKEALRRSEHDPDEAIRKIYSSTIGIFFFGTPHRGSREWASLGEGVARVASCLLGMDVNSEVVHALLPTGPELELCRESFAVQWEQRRAALAVRTFQESKGISGICWGGLNQLIVPPDSSTLDHPSQRARTLDGNHMTMVKFSGRSDKGYEMVKDDLEELMTKAPDMELTPSFGTTQDSRECLQMLRTSDYEQYKDRNPDRLDKTCEWFLHHENFHHWYKSDSSTLLWVSADPGCGKSVLAKYLIDQETELEASESRAVCYFFFKDDNEDQTSVTTALSALLHQLFSQRNSLIQHAMKDYIAEGSKLPRLFQKLWAILLKAASDPKAGEIICILDGLDECAEKGRYQIIDVLSAFYKQAISEESGSRLKFLITSRPYYDIQRRFSELTHNFPTIRLAGEEESEAIGREIDRVIKWKLSKLALELRLNVTEKATLETELLAMTHRTYLWATLVFDILYRTIRPTSRKLKDIVRSLPPTVDKAYEAIFSRIDDAERPQARKLLSIVVASSRPLTLQELNVALTVEVQHKSYNELRADLDDEERFESTVRNMCGLFVTILDQKIYLIHQTAKEFLVGNHEVLDGWKNSLHPVQSELILATSCIVPLTFSDFDDYQTPNEVSLGELLSGFEFLGYAASFWMAHFREAQQQATDELVQLVLQICNTSSRRFNTWSRLYAMTDPSTAILRFTTTMMLASYLGHNTVVDQLLKDSEADIDSKDNDHNRTPLAWAAKQGHISVVRLLIGTGRTDINSKDNDNQTPLWLACRTCREEIALFLLENGADPMDKNTRPRSPLLESALQGLSKVVDRILRSLSDQALQVVAEHYDTEGKSILNLALLGENGSHHTIVKMVIDALGQFPDQRRKLLYHQDHSNCSPLFHAALRNQPEAIKLLTQVEKGLLSQTGYIDWRDTPLHVATHWQSLNAVRALINAGANPNIQQRTGHTPLHIASHRTDGHDGALILKILLEHADPLISGHMGENIIHLVLDWDRAVHFQIIANHISYSDLHQLLTSKNKDGNIPLLHATAKLSHADHDYASHSKTFKAVCEAMIKVVSDADADGILDLVSEKDCPIILHRFIETSSADLMAEMVPKIAALDNSFLKPTDINGQTLLIKAVDRQLLRTIQLLIESSAHVNAQDKLGKTALHYAAERDMPEIARLLVHADADLTIKDTFGRMPVDWCSNSNSCITIVQPSDRSTIMPDPVAIMTPSTRSSRTSWSITLGAELNSCAWNLHGDVGWYSDAVPTIVREDKYVISEAIPVTIKLPVPRVHVVIEGRDQGWSDDRWFSDRPEGSFTSDSWYELAILRDGQLVLRREWARNKHRSKTTHRFECTWYSDTQRNCDHLKFAGRRAVSADDQGEFVRRLTVGDQVVILALAGGGGWMNIVKSASIEIFFED
ncbi:uncharacterized protein N7479_002491 [Penicillium vulpinum]|uniref:NACHT domain-containing protein n=1 Tax=Penicillium vulpinum TaxID=29845 RepID=A0A1V6RI19_9EURO|nr:uncharacterized protein N7479_002491 [Penicillium vulpinum]KAJ5972573.1 hypothetical protein N7479_002491 [Penicillium vulpinum]OQE01190.1 hypothetical protein PENVUL_c044G07249 [Penicillium vulpinum]